MKSGLGPPGSRASDPQILPRAWDRRWEPDHPTFFSPLSFIGNGFSEFGFASFGCFRNTTGEGRKQSLQAQREAGLHCLWGLQKHTLFKHDRTILMIVSICCDHLCPYHLYFFVVGIKLFGVTHCT